MSKASYQDLLEVMMSIKVAQELMNNIKDYFENFCDCTLRGKYEAYHVDTYSKEIYNRLNNARGNLDFVIDKLKNSLDRVLK